jgi:hypothetical protein
MAPASPTSWTPSASSSASPTSARRVPRGRARAMGIARHIVPMPRRGGAAAAGTGAPAPPARRGRRAGTPKRAFFRSSPYCPRPTLGFSPAALLPGDPSEADVLRPPSSARGPLTSPLLAPVHLTR